MAGCALLISVRLQLIWNTYYGTVPAGTFSSIPVTRQVKIETPDVDFSDLAIDLE